MEIKHFSKKNLIKLHKEITDFLETVTLAGGYISDIRYRMDADNDQLAEASIIYILPKSKLSRS